MKVRGIGAVIDYGFTRLSLHRIYARTFTTTRPLGVSYEKSG